MRTAIAAARLANGGEQPKTDRLASAFVWPVGSGCPQAGFAQTAIIIVSPGSDDVWGLAQSEHPLGTDNEDAWICWPCIRRNHNHAVENRRSGIARTVNEDRNASAPTFF